MNTISLKTNQTNDVTIISNIFIDQYMPTANGNFVKVYLYLLRCLTSHHMELSVSAIADRLEDTEKDIVRALSYWEKVGLITLTKNEANQITNIIFNTMLNPRISENHSSDNTFEGDNNIIEDSSSLSETKADVDQTYSNESEQKFDKPVYTKAQINELSKDNHLKFALSAIESYMQRPLKPTDYQLILYLYESIGFHADLIMYLYEYCISINKRSTSYIETVALSWAKEGLDTEEKAKQYVTQFNKSYQSVNKAFGLNRAPGDIEMQFINKWVMKLGFTTEIIVEACNRTLLRAGKPDFTYADRILENWATNKVTSLADIASLDAYYKQNNQTKRTPIADKPATNNKFNNFSQRSYTKEDYIKMEQLLINK